MSQLIDRTGLKINRLFVAGPSESRFHSGRKRVFWRCLCECGNICWIDAENLRSGKTSSCGCYRQEVLKKGQLHLLELRKEGWKKTPTHGMSGTKVHNTWIRIKTRCFCTTDKTYPFYGAQGITMCEQWRKSFPAFYAHVGDPPSPKHSIDRIDNKRGYEPGNVRWATRREQCNNRCNTVRYGGLTIVDLSHKYQIHFERLKYLLRQRGLSLAEALVECGIHSTNP